MNRIVSIPLKVNEGLEQRKLFPNCCCFSSHCWTRCLPGKWNGPSIILFGGEISHRHDFPSNQCSVPLYLCNWITAITLTVPLYDDDNCEYNDGGEDITHKIVKCILWQIVSYLRKLTKWDFSQKLPLQKTCISSYLISHWDILRFFQLWIYLFLADKSDCLLSEED